MSLKELDIAISYKSVGEESFSKIINPMLEHAKIYKRSVGFFSSSALDFIGDGILNMAKRGGKIFLATSPKLSEEDIDAIKKGYDAREIVEQAFKKEACDAINGLTDQNAQILFELIRDSVVDIKIVLKKGGMYHDKLALIEDWEENIVACVGSNNESGAGYNSNYEKIRVYKSWLDYEGRIEDEMEEFESIWTNTNDALAIYDFSDAFEKELLERIEHINPQQKKNKYKMRPYQEDAKSSWIKNGNKGFFVMATGTGKTITSLYSIQEFITENKIFTVIAVPYIHLIHQWKEDIKEFFPEADIVCVYGEVKDAESRIFTSYKRNQSVYKPTIVVTTIRSFFLDRYKSLYSKIEYEKLLIVDEAHNFLNSISDELSEQYPYKLGLSATPVFGKNEEKTAELLNWFGGQVVDLPIEKAIGKYLVDYEYHPMFVYASEEDEIRFANATALMLSAIDTKRNVIVDEEKFVRGYRGRLKAISMADEKISNIKTFFNEIPNHNHTIVYCSDGKLWFERSSKENETEEMRHLEYVLKLINQSIIDSKLKKASKFTASENLETRIKLIDSFDKGTINCLVAIRCLDEGINIPSIEAALILSSNDNYREFVQRRGRILRQYPGKKKADIYDVIVLPSSDNTSFAEIEFRRYYEYSRLALNKDELLLKLQCMLDDYGLDIEDIMFKNDYVYGGELDE